LIGATDVDRRYRPPGGHGPPIVGIARQRNDNQRLAAASGRPAPLPRPPTLESRRRDAVPVPGEGAVAGLRSSHVRYRQSARSAIGPRSASDGPGPPWRAPSQRRGCFRRPVEVDGNKRIALVVPAAFLECNGGELTATNA
jgi:hypothetical protein